MRINCNGSFGTIDGWRDSSRDIFEFLHAPISVTDFHGRPIVGETIRLYIRGEKNPCGGAPNP